MSKKNRSKKAKRRTPSKGDGKTCFTVMPFGGWFDNYYNDVFVPAIEAAGLKAERADDLYGPSAIINDIWAMTKRAAIVLADLTGKNPNVFYELGLAHAIAKPAVLLTASLDDVPFDLKSLRVIVYDKNDPTWGDDLKEAVTQALRETLERPAESVLPTFLAGPTVSSASVPKGENLELLQIRQELRSLRNQVAHSPTSREVSGLISGPDELREVIRSYLSSALPQDVIVEQVARRGVPRSVAVDYIRQERSRLGLRERKGNARARKARAPSVTGAGIAKPSHATPASDASATKS